MAAAQAPIFAALTRFKSAWPQRGWSYDNRFQCVASSFDASSTDTARSLIATLLPHEWTSRTIATAPPAIAYIAERTGGLRAAQRVYAAEPQGSLIPYGLWWPWEEGQTISLRIGLENASMSHTMDLCAVFGVEP